MNWTKKLMGHRWGYWSYFCSMKMQTQMRILVLFCNMKLQIRRKIPQEGYYTQGLCKLGVLPGVFLSEESISGAYWSNGERAGTCILVSVMLLSQQVGEHSKTCERPEVQCWEGICVWQRVEGMFSTRTPKPTTACEHKEALQDCAVSVRWNLHIWDVGAGGFAGVWYQPNSWVLQRRLVVVLLSQHSQWQWSSGNVFSQTDRIRPLDKNSFHHDPNTFQSASYFYEMMVWC